MIKETSQLTDYLCKKQTPLLYTFTIEGGQPENHMYLVYGYTATSTGMEVFAIDPNMPDFPPNLVTFFFDPWFTSSGTINDGGGTFGRPNNRDYMDICPTGVLTAGGTCPIKQ
jgi:hypothetical protein